MNETGGPPSLQFNSMPTNQEKMEESRIVLHTSQCETISSYVGIHFMEGISLVDPTRWMFEFGNHVEREG